MDKLLMRNVSFCHNQFKSRFAAEESESVCMWEKGENPPNVLKDSVTINTVKDIALTPEEYTIKVTKKLCENIIKWLSQLVLSRIKKRMTGREKNQAIYANHIYEISRLLR